MFWLIALDVMRPVKPKLILQLPASVWKFGLPSQAHFCLELGKRKILCKETFVKQRKKNVGVTSSIFHVRRHTNTHAGSRRFPFQCLFLRTRQSFAAANDCVEINGGKQSSAVSKQSWSLSPDPNSSIPPTTDLLHAAMERKDSHQTKFPRKIKRKASGINEQNDMKPGKTNATCGKWLQNFIMWHRMSSKRRILLHLILPFLVAAA